MNDKLNFKDWYKEKYDPTGYLYPSAPLSIGFQDYCARVNEYLEYLANGVDTRTEPALPIQFTVSSSRHPKCKGWKKYDWGMMDGPEYGCGYNTTIECNECMYCVGEKDPENYR